MNLSKITKTTAVLYAVANPEEAVNIAVKFPSQAVAIATALPSLATDISVALPDQAVAIASIANGPKESLKSVFSHTTSRLFDGTGAQLGELINDVMEVGAKIMNTVGHKLEEMEQASQSNAVKIAKAHPDQAVAIAKKCPSEAVAIAKALPKLAAKIAQALPHLASTILEAVPGAKKDFKL